MTDLGTITTRRNSLIKEKLAIWKQIELSYYGGVSYRDAVPSYLYKYPRESQASYDKRKQRAVYFNQVSPIVDLLVGFIFSNKPQRIDTNAVEYLLDDASKGKSLDAFMRTVAKWSLMFTCGVLVDAPGFDPEIVKTEFDREINNLNPFCLLYKPDRIRDFSVDPHGDLRWVLLDNSYIDDVDPFLDEQERTVYRLWTRTEWMDFDITTDINASRMIGGGTHNIGQVPFKFVNWRDDNIDFISESICEDLALINQAIYNNTSYMDEMIAAGTFKMLFYPTEDGKLPAELAAGVGNLSAIPFNAALSGTPFFDGAKLEDITPFVEAMQFYMVELLKKIGMEADEAKDFVKSGKARKLDFEKVKTLLSAGAMVLEETEKWIFEIAEKWNGRESKVDVNYNKDFLSEDVDERLARFAQLATLPYRELTKTCHALMTQTGLANDIEPEKMQELMDEIESSDNENINVNELAQIEKQAQEDENDEQNELTDQNNNEVSNE